MPAAVSHQGKEEAEANTSGSAPIGTETETEKQSRDSTGADTAASTSTPMDAASETGASVAAGNEAAQKSESQGASDTTVVSTVLSEFYLILALPQYGYTTAAMASCDTEVKPIGRRCGYFGVPVVNDRYSSSLDSVAPPPELPLFHIVV